MPGLVDSAMEAVRSSSMPPADEELLAPLESLEGYWETRRQHIGEILGNTSLSQTQQIDRILQGEALDGPSQERIDYHRVRFNAVGLIVDDKTIDPADKLQLLAEIQTGKTDVPGWHSNVEAIEFMQKTIPEQAPDGLVLRLDFTPPSRGEYPERRLIGATAVQFDVENPFYFSFDPKAAPELIDPGKDYDYVGKNSGMYLRHTPQAREWLRHHDSESPRGTLVYAIHTPWRFRKEWSPFGGFGFSASEYPGDGPHVMYGEEAITDFVTRQLTYGGARLTRIQEDVGRYPGFEFVHQIMSDGKVGADEDSVVERETLADV